MKPADLPRFHKRIIVAITLSASFLSVLTQFLLITALPKIMQVFGVKYTEVQCLTTRYMLPAAILIPKSTHFIDTFQTRNLMLSAMLLFSIATLIGLVATSITILLIGRFFQGNGS